MRSLRNIILAGMGSLALIGCMTTIHGSVGLSYVPARINEKEYTNEIKTELDVHADIPMGNANFTIGATNYTYIMLDFSNLEGLLKPSFQDYIFYTTFGLPIDFGYLEFYAKHNCFHPINSGRIMHITEGDSGYSIYSQGETDLGLRLKF